MAKEKAHPHDISQYVSNTDRDIYTVSNIPEEVVAVIFAYVSRSPKSFRENIGVVIEEEQLGQQRASKFHEKWVLNYGHASVAEHAAVHVGIERVSRLFSSVLELSNEYLSFTEYSQRYQRPKRGDFYIPPELGENEALRKEYIDVNNKLYDLYAEINDALYSYLTNVIPTPDGTDEKAHFRALEKVAFEDARYVLSMATFTNLGMTGNARAIEDSLTKLLSNSYPEVRQRAEEIKEEVRFSVPTLVKYADENAYLRGARSSFKSIFKEDPRTPRQKSNGHQVSLIDWTGKDRDEPENYALSKMINAMVYEHSTQNYTTVESKLNSMDLNEKLGLLQKITQDLGKYDNPVNAFRYVEYEAEFIISEACWHQLLRHRKVNWIYKEPDIHNGITVPPNIKEAGVEDLLQEAVGLSESLYQALLNENMPQVASYVVTNAHNRALIGKFDLWELYHLINLRMSEGAQWDIKAVIATLTDEIEKHHPNLTGPALKRVS